MHRDFPLPSLLERDAVAWLEGRGAEPTTPRPSATVMMLRDGALGLEVFVLRRASGMAFAPGMLVFPGGGVDPRDADPDIPWAGPSPQEWAGLLGTSTEQAQQLVIAAVREVFEETGVLLAGPSDTEVLGAMSGPRWTQERAALVAKDHSFSQLLRSQELVLRSDLISARGRWTTPECEPRRYDTWFFAAALPPGQTADGQTSEAVQARWTRPQDALADHQAGRELMLPPTLVMNDQLARIGSSEEVLAQSVPVRRVMPWPVEQDGRLWMRAPVDPDGHGLVPVEQR